MTNTGDVLGTIRYMAPEQLSGDSKPSCDIYGLGVTIYELLTLRPAYDSSNRLNLIEQIKNEEPARPRSIDARIPRDLETIILRAIDKEPERRYRSADAISATQQAMISQLPQVTGLRAGRLPGRLERLIEIERFDPLTLLPGIE